MVFKALNFNINNNVALAYNIFIYAPKDNYLKYSSYFFIKFYFVITIL